VLRTGFTDEQELFREAVRRFLLTEVVPNMAAWREAGIVPREMYRKAGAQGLLLMWADKQYGGLGLTDLRFEQVLSEEIGRIADCPFAPVLHNRVVGPYLGRIGTPEQKQRLLPRCISGEDILAVAMTEPGTGSDLAGMRSYARDKGDHWVLNGSKTYITNGLSSTIVIVAAKTDPDHPRALGLFIVEGGMPGFSRGRRLKKMGLHTQDTAELFFNDVVVPKANVLGDPRHGMRYLMEGLAEERICVAFGALAGARLAFDLTRQYVTERKTFGKRVSEFQNTRFRMAEIATEIELTQHYLDRCVLLANERRLAPEDAAMVKLCATEMQGRAVDLGVQLHGGAGYMDEYPISRLYCNARVTRIYGGSSEIMKEIIARSIFGRQ
jgi:acyl-CoA dehydrogenase